MNVVVEGDSDVGAVTAILRSRNIFDVAPIVKRGKNRLDSSIANYNEAGKREPWLILRDADRECPVDLRRRLEATFRSVPSEGLILRVACSMTEAWLMADRAKFADHFGVSESKVPSAPEEVPHAKRTLLLICAKSRSRSVRESVVADSGNRPGPLYVSRLNEFALDHWRPNVAAEIAPSLARALRHIDRKIHGGGPWLPQS